MQIASYSWKDFGEMAYCSLMLEQNGKADRRDATTSLGAQSKYKWRNARSKTNSGLELSSVEEASLKRLSNNYNIRLEDHIHHSSWSERQARSYTNEEFLRSQSCFYMQRCDSLQKQLNDLYRELSASSHAEQQERQVPEYHEHKTHDFFEKYLQKLNAKLLKEASKSCKLETLLMRYEAAIAERDSQITQLQQRVNSLTEENAKLKDNLTAEQDRYRRKAYTMNAQRFELENRLIADLEHEELNFQLQKDLIKRYDIENAADGILSSHYISNVERALLTQQIEHFLRSKAVSVIFGIPLAGTRSVRDIAGQIERGYSREAMRRALSYYAFDFSTEEMLTLVEQYVFCTIQGRSAQI